MSGTWTKELVFTRVIIVEGVTITLLINYTDFVNLVMSTQEVFNNNNNHSWNTLTLTLGLVTYGSFTGYRPLLR